MYGLAATLYAAASGRGPFDAGEGQHPAAQISRVMSEAPADLRPHGVPAALAGVIEAGLRKDPQQRHATTAAMRDCLARVRDVASLPRAVTGQAGSSLPGLTGAATAVLLGDGAQPATPAMRTGLPPAGPPGAAQADLSPAPRARRRTAVLSVAVVAVIVVLGLAGAAAGAGLFSRDGGGESEDARSGQMVSSSTATETTAPATPAEATAPPSSVPSTSTSTSTTTAGPPTTSPPRRAHPHRTSPRLSC